MNKRATFFAIAAVVVLANAAVSGEHAGRHAASNTDISRDSSPVLDNAESDRVDKPATSAVKKTKATKRAAIGSGSAQSPAPAVGKASAEPAPAARSAAKAPAPASGGMPANMPGM